MKRILLPLTMAIVLLLGLAACGSGSSSGQSNSASGNSPSSTASATTQTGASSAESSDTAATTTQKPKSIVDCIATMTVDSVEDGVIFWTVKFDGDFDKQGFDGLDFVDVIKQCFSREENRQDGITDYSIFAYDKDGNLRMSWGRPNDSYDYIHEWDSNGNPITPEYMIGKDTYDELLQLLGK